MEPINFPEKNVVYAANQPEFRPLPAYRDSEVTVSCWKLSLWERLKIMLTGKLWLLQKNYGKPLQPQLPTVDWLFEPHLSGDPADDYDYNMSR